MSTLSHGTVYAYRKGCRCEPCRAAHWDADTRWRQKAPERPIPHGTLNGYRIYGCRCQQCRDHKLDYDRRRRRERARIAEQAAQACED